MKEYFISVIIVVMCAGICSLLFDGGNDGSVGNSVRMVGAICVIAAVLIPIIPIFKSAGTVEGYIEKGLEILKFDPQDDISENAYTEIFKSNIAGINQQIAEEYILDELASRYKIDREDCVVSVIITNENDEFKLSKITITLSGQAVWKDPYSIEEYFGNIFECQCFVRSSN